MQTFHDAYSLESWISQQKESQLSIGFVPTMGALHQGHLSLVKESKSQNDFTICSVFVNPTQFDNPDDLKKYPRDIQTDSEFLRLAGCDILFYPDIKDMYPDNVEASAFEFGELDKVMEGKFRVGHFDGVATIVSRFFDIIQPDRAYFGEKDFQQLRIIQEMVKLKDYDTEIISVPIFREKSGLAMSSRNRRLSSEFLSEAAKIYKALNLIMDWRDDYSVNETIRMAEEYFLKSKLNLEYILICDEKTLKPISTWDEAENARVFIAAFADDIRLIDNLKII